MKSEIFMGWLFLTAIIIYYVALTLAVGGRPTLLAIPGVAIYFAGSFMLWGSED